MEKKCLYPNCDRKADSRGLCHRHYQVARLVLVTGLVSDDDLVRRGKIAPRKTRLTRDVRKWFEEEK